MVSVIRVALVMVSPHSNKTLEQKLELAESGIAVTDLTMSFGRVLWKDFETSG